ncbi:MAG: hypothetical protein U9R60_00705 [Bacteroidota bacterium]|nr:hypothetical protein [Bacteroidota bacterium]
MLLSAFAASQAQLITFNALKNGVIDDAEIKKELILNGFTKITGSSDSSTDTYAFRYDEEEETAAIWVLVKPFYGIGSLREDSGLFMIQIQSFGIFSQDNLKEEIVQKCTFEGIGDDDALMYKFESHTVFNISSVDGTNYISVYPLFNPGSSEAEPDALEWQRQEQERIERERRDEQERIERERQEQAERLNNMGRDAFGNQGVGETEGSEGIAQGSGNQGDPSGSPDADHYGTGGGLGDGISFGGLGSRRARGSIPKPNLSGCDITQKMEIKVEVQVDRNGNVVSATVSSATYQDKCIWDMVIEAAKKSKFSVDQSSSYRQTGWIKYIIVP